MAVNEELISVVIPTYNRAERLMATISSVLTQTYRNFEIIIVDDGSTDSTPEAIDALIKNGCEVTGQMPPIRYFYQPNKGQSAARNKGISEAVGNWIAFLDSDDLWLPEKLEWQIRAIEQFQGGCGACITDARLVDSQGLNATAFQKGGSHYTETIGIIADPLRSLAKAFGGSWIQTLVARGDLVRQIGGFDPDIRFGEDYDFLFRLSMLTAHCYVNKELAVIDRTNSVVDPSVASRTWDRVDFRLRERQDMYEKWLKLTAQYPDVRTTIIGNLRAVHSGWTNWYLENGQFDKARKAASTALKYQMTPQLALKWALTWIVPRLARRIVPRTARML
jgi:glycosyltransferase involved in cell wall biosynthesis